MIELPTVSDGPFPPLSSALSGHIMLEDNTNGDLIAITVAKQGALGD